MQFAVREVQLGQPRKGLGGRWTHNSAEEGLHLGLPEGGEVECGIVLRVAGIVYSDEPGDEGFRGWVGDDVRSVGGPLFDFVYSVHCKVVVQGKPANDCNLVGESY